MCLAEELKHLISIRRAFLGQLTNLKSTNKSKVHLREVIDILDRRIQLILEAINCDNISLKEATTKQLRDSKSSWFDELSKGILRAIVINELADQINFTAIFQKIFNLTQ